MADRTSTVRVQVDAVADRASGVLKKFGAVAATAGAAGAVALGAVAVASVNAASDVQQSFGAVSSVFKQNADEVQKWASEAATSVGLSKSAYADLAAIVGAQLKNMGMNLDEATVNSNRLIATGADLSATFGGSVADAVGAVSSLLRGETDPIERYGVSIKQADINAQLAAEGLDGLTGKAAKQAQAQAILTLLTKQTADAQGAFAKESDTLAGQQARLSAEFDNVKAALGERLIPIVTQAITYFREDLAPVIADVAARVSTALAPSFEKFGGYVQSTVLPALQRFGTYVQENIVPALGRLGAFVIERVVPALGELFGWVNDKVVPLLRDNLAKTLEGARGLFNNVADAVRKNSPELKDMADKAKKLGEFLLEKVAPVLADLQKNALPLLGTAIGVAIDQIANIYKAFTTLRDIVQATIDKVAALITKLDQLRGKGNAVKGAEPGKIPTNGPTGDGPLTQRSGGMTVNFNGPVTDPQGTARQIEQLGRRYGVLTGARVSG